MSGLEESAFVVAVIALVSLAGKKIVSKIHHKFLKKSILKNVESAVKAADLIYQELQECGLSVDCLPIVKETVDKIESLKNSELGSKVQKDKVIKRLLYKLESSVTEEMYQLIDEQKIKLEEDKKLRDQADTFEKMLKTLDTSNITQTAMNLAKSFSPPEEVEITPEQKHLNKILARSRGRRR